jgi:hypothetical protein
MCVWKQGGFLSRIYPYTVGNQSRQEQIEGNQGHQTTYQYQDDQVFCGPVQFLPDSHQGFCADCSTLILTHTERFRLQIWTSAR